MIEFLLEILAFLLLPNLLVPGLLNVFASIKGSKRIKVQSSHFQDLACVVTVYKSHDILEPLLKKLTECGYPKYKIYLVLDQCPPFDLHFDSSQIKVIEPFTPLNSKVRSIKLAINSFDRKHDAVIIFDPDNVPKPNFLSILNNYLQVGYRAVQGKRIAKNLDTPIAKLDALGESYYNRLKEVYYRLGGSASISGSGMAFETNLFKEILDDPIFNQEDGQVIAGEDKYFQYLISLKGEQIAFANEAEIYDEKIENLNKLKRQRTRWLKAYFDSWTDSFKVLTRGIVTLNWLWVLMGFEGVKLPNFIMAIATIFTLGISWLLDLYIFEVLVCSLMFFMMNFLISAYQSAKSISQFSGLWYIPSFILSQVMALFSMGAAKKDFLVTEKRKIDIPESNVN